LIKFLAIDNQSFVRFFSMLDGFNLERRLETEKELSASEFLVYVLDFFGENELYKDHQGVKD
jgi:hypothetical protein